MGGEGEEGLSLEDLLKTRLRGDVEEEFASEFEKELPRAELEYDANRNRAANHHALMEICASAFGPESPASGDLDFRFLFADPLTELGGKNFDLFIFDSSQRYGILVECKAGMSNPGKEIAEIYETAEVFEGNLEYFQKYLGSSIDLLDTQSA